MNVLEILEYIGGAVVLLIELYVIILIFSPRKRYEFKEYLRIIRDSGWRIFWDEINPKNRRMRKDVLKAIEFRENVAETLGVSIEEFDDYTASKKGTADDEEE